MNNPFERFECWHPRCAHYAPLGVRLTLGELRQNADDILCCRYCGKPVRVAQPGFLVTVWQWFFGETQPLAKEDDMKEHTPPKSPGQIAFEAYNESKGGLTYDGKPIPPWDELSGDKAAVHRAWEAAANALVDDYKEHLSKNPIVAIALARYGINLLPRSREQALTLTKLDEAALWFGMVLGGTEP